MGSYKTKMVFTATFLLLSLLVTTSSSRERCSTLTTFNTGLLHHIPQLDTRRSHTAAALRDTGSDVMCLQEVWLESDMRSLVTELQDIYPHHYSAIHYRQGDIRKPTSEMGWMEKFKFLTTVFSPCSASEYLKVMLRLLPCAVREGCLGKLSSSSTLGIQCLAMQCPSVIKSLSQQCYSCLVLQGGSLSGTISSCSPNIFNRLNDLNGPGLMLLSKTPMTSLKYVDYFPDRDMVTTRGYLQAEIEGTGKIVCTHLTSAFPHYYEYDLDFGNFTAQQAAEIDTLGRQFGGEDHLLLGDLNTGPSVVGQGDRNLTAELGDNYRKLTGQYQYRTPYFSDDGRCTYCRNNPLVNYTNVVIDHILVKGQSQSVSNMERTLDQALASGPPLSDHYGVKAKICTN